MTQPLLTEDELVELRRMVADRPPPPPPKPLHVVMVEVERWHNVRRRAVDEIEAVDAQLVKLADERTKLAHERPGHPMGQAALQVQLGDVTRREHLQQDRRAAAERRAREAGATLGELAEDEARLSAALDVAVPQHHAARVAMARGTHDAAEAAMKAAWGDVKRATTADDLEAIAGRLRAAQGQQRWAADRLAELEQRPANKRWWQR